MTDDEALDAMRERWGSERHGLPPADRARAHRLPPEGTPPPFTPVEEVAAAFRGPRAECVRYPGATRLDLGDVFGGTPAAPREEDTGG